MKREPCFNTSSPSGITLVALKHFSQLFLDVPTRSRRLLGSTMQQSTQRLETATWIIQIIHRDEALQIQWFDTTAIPHPKFIHIFPRLWPVNLWESSVEIPGSEAFWSTDRWTLWSILSTICILSNANGQTMSGQCLKKKRKIWASLPVIQSLFCGKGFYLLPSLAQTKLLPLAPRRGDS